MSRRDNSPVRCPRCHVHVSLCLCSEIPSLVTLTKLVLIIHRIEHRKPTNTGLLASACLTNSEVWLRGNSDATNENFALDRDTLPLLLFPGEGATPLEDFAGSPRPISLIVPDGTWRQASKVPRRVPALAKVPLVSLPKGPVSEYRLRHEPRDGGLATMEAIARAFGVLEGPAVQQALERVFRIMVDRALWARGELETARVTGGIPEGVLRHDPLSGGASRNASG